MTFRKLITPFYLCRDIDATWEGEYIIPRSRKRPVPEVVVPDDRELEAQLTSRFRNLRLGTNADGAVNLAEVRFRTDQLKKLAWCPLYASVQSDSNAKAQAVIKSSWSRQSITARMRDLIQEIKRIKALGERFIICAESIFLMSLATHVIPLRK